MKRTSAMTLVEMTVAMAIVALLAGAALHVVSNLSGMERATQAQYDVARTEERVRDAMAPDLLQATSCRKAGQGFSLRTYVTLDAVTLEPQHLMATVTYAVQKIGDRPWLVRTQEPDFRNEVVAELVCPDVKAVTLEEVAGEGMEELGWMEAPSPLTVMAEFPGEDRIPALWTFRRE